MYVVTADTAMYYSENYCSLTVADYEHKVLGVFQDIKYQKHLFGVMFKCRHTLRF